MPIQKGLPSLQGERVALGYLGCGRGGDTYTSMRLALKTKPEHIAWAHMLATGQEFDVALRYDSAWTFDHF